MCVNYTLVGLPLLKGFHQAKTHGSCSSLTPWGTVTFLPLPPSLRAPSAPPPAPQHAAGPSLSSRWMSSSRGLSSHTFFQVKYRASPSSKDRICGIILISPRPTTSATHILGNDKHLFTGMKFCLCRCLMLHNWPTNLCGVDLSEP